MGKVKRARQKYHISLNKNEGQSEPAQSQPELYNYSGHVFNPPTDNIFAGINISFDDIISKKIDTDDTRSVRSFKSIKSQMGIEKQISKKDKKKLRHDLFLRKIDVTKQAKVNAKKQKQRQKKAVTGDMKPLADALPSLDSLLKLKFGDGIKQAHENKIVRKAIHKKITRKMNLKKDKDIFLKLMTHPDFKKNPKEIIAAHIEEKILQQAADE